MTSDFNDLSGSSIPSRLEVLRGRRLCLICLYFSQHPAWHRTLITEGSQCPFTDEWQDSIVPPLVPFEKPQPVGLSASTPYSQLQAPPFPLCYPGERNHVSIQPSGCWELGDRRDLQLLPLICIFFPYFPLQAFLLTILLFCLTYTIGLVASIFLMGRFQLGIWISDFPWKLLRFNVS